MSSVKRKLLYTIIISVLFTLFFNFFTYNFRLIVAYILDLEIIAPRHYLLRFCGYFLFAYLFSRKHTINNIFYILFIPVFILDSSAIFFGRTLIPLRFPFDTLYPLAGILCGLSVAKNSKRFLIIFSLSILFIFFSEFYLRSLFSWYTKEWNNDNNTKNIYILPEKFLTIDNKSVVLSDTIKSKVKLIELYFVGCEPCEQKYETLKELADTFSSIQIALICDGKITKYKDFLAHAKLNGFKNIIFLYDHNGFLRKQKWVRAYPTELLFNNDSLVNIDRGFGMNIKERWIEKEKRLIKQILYEK